MDNLSIRDRMALYLEFKGISDYRFEKDLGLSKGYWNKAKNPTSEIVGKFVGFYTDISPEWLLTGNGEMTKQPTNQETPVSTNNSDMESAFLKKEAFYLRQMNERLDELIEANETIENLKEEVESLKKQLELAEQDSDKMAVNVVKHKFA